MTTATDIASDLQLPSLPEVILRALDACHSGQSYREISRIVSADTALVTRLLALTSSALYQRGAPSHSVEQALLRLGTRKFQTLLLTSALRQLMFELGGDEWQQLRDFWRHSLTTALTAKTLATLTRYPEPEEAFLLGMMHNIGELIAIKTPCPERKQQILNQQNDIAAGLVSSWGLGTMAVDAMRYQQALPGQLRDAGHLVKVVSLSTRLALSDAVGVGAAATIFGLQEDLTREINKKIGEEVASVAASLGIPLDTDYDAREARRQLNQRLLEHTMVRTALALPSSGPENIATLVSEAASSLTLITGLPVLCFSREGEDLTLRSGTCRQLPELSINPASGDSALTTALRTDSTTTMDQAEPTVLDQQLCSLLGAPSLLALPVATGASVFVIGIDDQTLVGARNLGELFTRQLSAVLEQSSADSLGSEQQMVNDRLRRQVHEVSNPLTIIRQYLFQLRSRLQDSTVQDELNIIQEELDRAGNLLLQISQHTAEATGSDTDLNEELTGLGRILQDSLFHDDSRELRLNLCNADARVQAAPSAVRQIVLNLVRNASEGFDDRSGTVTLSTTAPLFQNRRRWVELQVADNGPGIPEALQRRLFEPVNSTKGDGHSGLGLSIVKQLIDDMEGIIACHTGQEGTAFRILLPAASHNDNDTD
ncbi:HDOD domain-containing protein [Pseudomonadota bacterium 24LQ007]|uniref:HDOD domain-containing protein n=1 Tax=Marinobacter sp. ST-43 TaxID=3050453 RepID=UPI0026E0C5BA|nr:HDOD domain-containing protein [Marinobacter sp. ST-43]MEC9041187.1 HDOD domain-containing protein [Pseudomonadota bacterium]